MKLPKGFTLIELLIVVAIIAILAAIAVPNFLEAQTRAKVSRVKTDMRSLAVALESYAVDNNNYPYAVNGGNSGHFPLTVTTPIAYMTSLPIDIFRTFAASSATLAADQRSFIYWRFISDQAKAATLSGTDSDEWGGATIAPGLTSFDRWGRWVMTSFGPDKKNSNALGGISNLYDPTNGTVSDGDIARSQAQSKTNTN